MYQLTYVFAVISALAWAITTVVVKNYLIGHFNPMELYILRMGVGFSMAAVILFLLFEPNLFTNLRSRLTKQFMFFFVISVITGVTGIFAWWKVLKINNGSYSTALVWPMVVLFTTLISYYFYNEKISTIQCIGIGVVIIGLFMLNIKDKDK
jgi:drug/metabolite transporter (DMT)-like permease|tara:strand:- start:23 stop:478 length:456 start_codon:yes stop_codon:yes gene_type:complete